MADDIKFVASIVPQIDASNMSGGISQLQEYFNKLKLPPKLGDGFKDLFTDAIGKAEKFQDVLAKGGKDKRSFSELTRSADTALDAIDRIQKKMNSISDEQFLSNLEVDPNIFKDVDRQIEETEQKIKESFEKLGKIDISGIEKARDALQQLSSSNAVGQIQQNFEKAFSTGDFSKIEDTMRVLISNMVTFGAAKDKVKDGIEQIRKSFAEGNFGAVSEEFRDLLGIMPKLNDPNITQGEERLRRYITQVQILFNAFKNSKDLDVTNLTAELDKLKESRENLEKEYQDNALGDFKQAQQGVTAYAQGMRTAEKSVRDTQKAQVDLNTEIGQLKNRIQHFFGLVNAVQLFRRALKDTFNTVKELDASMTETAVVTDFTVGDMWDQLPQYTATAKEFGATIKGVYDVMTLYYQQGLNQDTAWALGTETLKLARIAGLDYAEATDRMTNALRGFNMELNQQNAQRVDDVYSKLAAMSASNVDELSVAMTKTASIAKSANMEFETTAAFLAQIIETTREAPETAGTALKTVIARFSEVKDLYTKGQLTGEDSEGEKIDVNKVSKALGTAGIDMSKYFTGEVGLDTIFMELAEKWDSLDLVQQRYIATQAAGSRQQSRFIAMLSDYGRTLELVEGAENANGASAQQFEKTQESLETKLNRLKDTWQEFSMGLANNQVIKGAVDALTKLLEIINKLTQGTGDFSSTFLKMTTLIAGFKGGSTFFNKGITKVGTTLAMGMGIGKGDISKDETNLSNGETLPVKGFHPIQKVTNKLTKMNTPRLTVLPSQSAKIDADIGPASGKFAALKAEYAAFRAMINENPIYLQLDDTGAIVGLQSFLGESLLELEGFSEIEKQFMGKSLGEAAQEGAVSVSEAQELMRTEIAKSTAQAKLLEEEIEKLQAKNVTQVRLNDDSGFVTKQLPDTEEIKQLKAQKAAQDNYTNAGYRAMEKLGQQGQQAGKQAGSKFTRGFNAAVGDTKIGKFFTKIATTMGLSGGAAAGAAFVGAFVAAIAVIGGAIALAIYNSSGMENKRFLEGLGAGASTLDNSIKSLQESVDNLQESLDKFGKGNYFDGIIKGSTEWYKRVLEQNTEVSELINKYRELGLAAEYDENGILQLSNGTELVKKLQDQQKENLYTQNLINGYSNYKREMQDLEYSNSQDYVEALIKYGSTQIAFETAATAALDDGNVKDYFLYTAGAAFSQPSPGDQNYNAFGDIMQASVEANAVTKAEEAFNKPDELGISQVDKYKKERETIKQKGKKYLSSILENEFNANSYSADYAALLMEQSGQYENFYQTGENLKNSNREEYKKIISQLGYYYSGDTLFDSEGKEVTDDKELKKAVAAVYATNEVKKESKKIMDTYTGQISNIASKLETDKENQYKVRNTLGGILAEDYSADLTAMQSLFTKEGKLKNKNALNGIDFSALGFKSQTALEKAIEDNYLKILGYQKEAANEGIGRLAFDYEGLSPKRMGNVIEEYQNLDAADQIQITEQFQKLEEYGKPELLAKYQEALVKLQAAGKGIADLKFNNLIELNENFKKLEGSKENLIDEVDLFRELGSLGTLDDMNDQLTEFIEKNGQITSDNVKDLSEQYPILEQYIGDAEEGTVELENATLGLANVLTYLKKSGKSYVDITKNILKAASATKTLGNLTAEMSDFVDNFSAGVSNFKGVDFLFENAETVQEYSDKKRLADASLRDYLKTMFSEQYIDEKGVDNQGMRSLVNQYQTGASRAGFNILNELVTEGNLSDYFSINGNTINLTDKVKQEGLSLLELYNKLYEANEKNLGNKYSKGAIDSVLSGLLGKLDVSWSRELATQGMYDLVDAYYAGEDKNFLLNDTDIDYVATMTGTSKDEIIKYIKTKNQNQTKGNNPQAGLTPEFMDEKGNKLEGENYVRATLGLYDLNSLYNGTDNQNREEYETYKSVMKGRLPQGMESFYHNWSTKTSDAIKEAHGNEVWDIDYMEKAMEGWTEEQKSNFWTEWEKSGMDQGKQYTKKYSYIDKNNEQQYAWAFGNTKEEVQQQIDDALKEIDYSKMGAAIAEQFSDTEIKIVFNDDTTTWTDIAKKAKEVLEKYLPDDVGDRKITFIVDQSVQTEANKAVSQVKSAFAQLAETDFVIKVKGQASLENNNSTTTTPEKDGSGRTGQNNKYAGKKYMLTYNGLANTNFQPVQRTFLEGTENNNHVLRRNETVLTGEEGPELIQYADGGAYLTGTQGPEMTTVNPHDIIYNADQTEDIYNRGGFGVKRAEQGIGNNYKNFKDGDTKVTTEAGDYNPELEITDADVNIKDSDVNVENSDGDTEYSTDQAQTMYDALNSDDNFEISNSLGSVSDLAMSPWTTGVTALEQIGYGEYGDAQATLQNYFAQTGEDASTTITNFVDAVRNGTDTLGQAFTELVQNKEISQETLNKLPGSMDGRMSSIGPQLQEAGVSSTQFNQYTTEMIDKNNTALEQSEKRMSRISKIQSALSKSQTATLACQVASTAELASQYKYRRQNLNYAKTNYKYAKEEVEKDKDIAKYIEMAADGTVSRTEAYSKLNSAQKEDVDNNEKVKAAESAGSTLQTESDNMLDWGTNMISGISEIFSTGKGIYDTMKGYAEKIAQYITQAIEVVVSAWTNREDWLYNFLNRIEKELHEFEKLQEYANQIDEGRVVSYQELMQNWDDQFESLQKQLEMQNERVEARQQYLDWSKFIPFTLISGWSPVTDTLYENRTVKFMWDLMIGFGQMVPMFGDVFKSLNELYEDYDKRVQENYEDRLEAEKAILEIESERLKLVKAGAEEATEFEEKVMDAFIQKEQESIDELSRLNEAITGANQTLIDTLKDNLDEVRRIRENTDTEENLTDKEIRLAYLRQDTSNANMNEIKKLEKDLEKENESYTDKLIDQRINDLTEQNEYAAEQRQKQIDLLQGQLDWAEKYGVYWDHIYGMLYTIDENGNIGLNTENFDERGFLRANGELSKMLNTFSDIIGESIWKTLMDNEDLKKLGVYYNAFIQYNGNEGIWRRQDMLQNPDINDNGYVSWWADKNAGPFWQFFAKIEDDWHDFWMNNDLGLWNDTALALKKVADFFLKIWGWITGQTFESKADAWIKEGGFKSEHDNTPFTEFWFKLFNGLLFNTAATGTDSASAGDWLVGEEGPELIQFANGGAYLAGTRGPEMVPLSNGDKVYNNSDTKQIFGRGPSFGRLAAGNATLALTEPKWIEDLVERGIKEIGNLTKNTAENNRTIVNEVHLNIENMNGDRQSAEDAAQIVIDRLDEIAKYRSTNYIGHPMK